MGRPRDQSQNRHDGLQWGFLRNNTVAKWFGERPFSPEELDAMKAKSIASQTQLVQP